MLDVMFDIPGMTNVKEVVIDDKVIKEGNQPKLVYYTDEEMKTKAEQAAKKQSESA